MSVATTAAGTELQLDHLKALEAESIHIMREVVAEFERPVMLYSIGKDSSVLLRLAQHDRIIDNAPTRRFVERFASSDREVIEYPGAHHTLEFEPEPDRFVNDLLRWLDRHTPDHP